MMFTALPIIAFFTLSQCYVVPRMVSGFASTCSGESLANNGHGYILSANCENSSGGYDATSIDLGHCLGDDDGTLIFQPNGFFGNSCKNVVLEDIDVLHASCLNGNKYDSTSINLDTLIANQNGTLVC